MCGRPLTLFKLLPIAGVSLQITTEHPSIERVTDIPSAENAFTRGKQKCRMLRHGNRKPQRCSLTLAKALLNRPGFAGGYFA